MIPVTTFGGRKVAVFGLGLSGRAAAVALRAGGAEVAAWDDSEASREAARAQGLPVRDLREADWRAFAALVLAPGAPLTHPEPHWTVKRARGAGVEVIGDTELFCRERRAQGARAKLAAITGTNGKSTTTALTAHLLAAAGRRAVAGGNIGRAALDLPPFADGLFYVIEFSSFQIDLTPTLDPEAAALLNITPDHLDRHGTLDHYAAVKARIFARQKAGDTAVVGVDDPISAAIAGAPGGAGRVRRISCQGPVADGVYASAGRIIEAEGGVGTQVADLAGIGSLRGAHNWQNAAAAYALVRGLGLSPGEAAAGFASFPGLAHRMEEAGRLGRVLFINDSKATNADAAGKALASFDDIYWIAGGRAKAGGLAGLEGLFPRICRAYFIGEAAEAFSRFVDGRLAWRCCGTLEAALGEAARDAAAEGRAAPVVLLSPACASYDQYPNFEARGDAFRRLVMGLIESSPLSDAQALA